MTPRRMPLAGTDVVPERTDERTDRELVVAARGGEVRAFDALFYRYRDGSPLYPNGGPA